MSYNNITVEKYQGVLPKKFEYKFSRITRQNHVIDVLHMTRLPKCHIKRLSKKFYVNLKTGEVRAVMPKIEGVQFRNIRSLKIIFKKLRQLITTNFEGAECEKFLTLTYRDQTNDPQKIYKDLDIFNKRLRRAYSNVGYIHIVEPHASGNWHVHSLVKRVDGEVLNMTYDDIFKIWGNGWVTVENLNNVDNIGAYFIAYFSNMEIPDDQLDKYPDDIKEKNGKKYIKGRRLDFYPDYMKIYRNSLNLKKPEIIAEIPDNFDKTYEVAYKITVTDNNENVAESYIKTEQHKKGKKQ